MFPVDTLRKCCRLMQAMAFRWAKTGLFKNRGRKPGGVRTRIFPGRILSIVIRRRTCWSGTESQAVQSGIQFPCAMRWACSAAS